MDKKTDEYEKKLKLASNYFIYSVLIVTVILFLIYGIVKFLSGFFGMYSFLAGWILGAYILIVAIYLIRKRIRREI